MAVLRKEETKRGFDSHRLAMIRKMAEIDAAQGVTGEPTMTVEEILQSQLDRGVRPEDRLGSRELMRMRYGDDWEWK